MAFIVRHTKSTVRLHRIEQLFTFLRGRNDPNSPVSLLDDHTAHIIASYRSEPVQFLRTVDDVDVIEYRDPDNISVLHRGGDLPAIVSPDGVEYWFKDGQQHREGDKPAYIHPNGSLTWYKNNLRHRDGDKPARVFTMSNGKKNLTWYKNGKIHRDGDKPAMIGCEGMYWYRDGRIHRDGDEPAIIRSNGTREWYKDGCLHRDSDDRPAYMGFDGTLIWYRNGSYHREGDKPAVILPDGTLKWYMFDKLQRSGKKPCVIYGMGIRM